MNFILLLLSLISFSYANTSDWKTHTDQLIEGGDKETAAREALKNTKDLDKTLLKALDKGAAEENYALNTIKYLPMPTLADQLLKRALKMNVLLPRTESYIVTLLSVVNGEEAVKTIKALQKKIDLKSQRISASLKLAYLSSMSDNNLVPEVHLLNHLLEDNSYEFRLKVMDTALPSIEKEPKKYESFLKKAMVSTPFPLRLRALEQIKLLSKEDQVAYRALISKCAQNDQHEAVKEACKALSNL